MQLVRPNRSLAQSIWYVLLCKLIHNNTHAMFIHIVSVRKTKLATVLVYTLDGYSSLIQLYPSRLFILILIPNTDHDTTIATMLPI